jgi:mannose-6-phosphate isomerase-like protein (cupin superfamily)
VASESDATTVLIKVARDDLTLTWSRYEPGESGPGPHVHHHHADCFYVLGGELTFELGPDAQVVGAPAGTFVAVPIDVVHTFRNDGSETAYFLNFHAPSCGFHEQLLDEDASFDSDDPPDDGGRPAETALVRAPGGPRLESAGREQEPGRLAVTERDVEEELRVDAGAGVWILAGELHADAHVVVAGDYVDPSAPLSLTGAGRVLLIETA